MLVTMAGRKKEGELFAVDSEDSERVIINTRCQLRTKDGYRVLLVCGMVLAHYPLGDRMGEAHAMVLLVEQGWAKQKEVARAFGCTERTVRRQQRRFESGGLSALGRPKGYPAGRPRLPAKRMKLLDGWKAEGEGNREIARRLGVTENAVRKVLRRLGWKPTQARQRSLALTDAHPKLSAFSDRHGPVEPKRMAPRHRTGRQKVAARAHPKLSGSADDCGASSYSHVDPAVRNTDRVLACVGLLDDAAPLFRSANAVPHAGVLLAIPALLDSGVFDIARELYGGIGPAFYGLRTTILTLLLMGLLRIKRPEGLKEHSPEHLGMLLGLDRAPEVKTMRRKLSRMAAYGLAVELGRALARRRVETHGYAMGFLYVDGHVRAYHGKRNLPKAHLARMRLSMPATTDYWVNDAEGEPLFVVTTEANRGLVHMLPVVLEQVRSLVGERRVTVVFDRGGWSPKLFKKLINEGFDIMTYKKHFAVRTATIDGREVTYTLADRGVLLLKRKLRLRQVTRLSDNGHQTPIITSRRDLPAIEVAYRMFERWRQENFFKYLREEYAIDALVDYEVEPADAQRTVPNPKRKELNAELRRLYAEVNQVAAEYGIEALSNREDVRRTMRGFKIANAKLSGQLFEKMERLALLEKKRAQVPARVPVHQVTEGEVIKLSVERKHLTDLFKMVAYQAEGDLLRLITPHYRRAEAEGRTLIQNALETGGDIEVTETELRVSLDPLSSPHRTKALAAICKELNDMRTRFPGSKLCLHFDVKPDPQESLAFPGPRPAPSSSGGKNRTS
jgi:transposase